jgi:hypothetical protein
MSLEEKLEEKIQKTKLKMKELSLALERLNQEYQQLLDELASTPEQIKDYLENSDNFTPPIWEMLQNEKKKLDDQLNLELSLVRDPLKLKKTFSEKGSIQNHWLFVR